MLGCTWEEEAKRWQLFIPELFISELFKAWEETSMGLFPVQFLFCLSSLTEATVMCFDQCHSRSVHWPAYHRLLPAGHTTTFLCVSVCGHVGVFCGKWGDDTTEPAETEQTSFSHYPLGGLARCGRSFMWHMHTVQTLSGIFQSFICKLRCKHTQTHTVSVPGRILESFSANLSESLALIRINVRDSAHDGWRTEEDRLKSGREIQVSGQKCSENTWM